jgi:hypothetical protein
MLEKTQIPYGNGNITIIVSTESTTEVKAPDIRFGRYYDTAVACFSEKELSQIELGSSAQVSFSYVMTDELDNSQQVQAFEEAIALESQNRGRINKGVFFEVEANKEIAGEEVGELDTLYDDVEIQFDIPLYLSSPDRVFMAMTDAKGVIDVDDDVDEDAVTLSVSTHNVGTTLLAYQEKKDMTRARTTKLLIPPQYLAIAGIIALVLLWLAVDKRYKKGRD